MADIIDGANICLVSGYGDYGTVRTEEREIPIRVLAICRYDDEDQYYLFACDKDKLVISDTVHRSIDEAVLFSKDYYGVETYSLACIYGE